MLYYKMSEEQKDKVDWAERNYMLYLAKRQKTQGNQKIKCSKCGSEILFKDRRIHFRTKKHQNFIKSQE